MSPFDPTLPGLYAAADIVGVLHQEAHHHGDHAKATALAQVAAFLADAIVGAGGLSRQTSPDTIAELMTDPAGGVQ